MPAESAATLQLLIDALKAVGSARITLRGTSMDPTLRDGWILHVRSLPAEQLRVGDIGAFVHGGLLTIHRLIWKKQAAGGLRLVFQGDNNPHREEVAPEAVLGRVEAAEQEREGANTSVFPVGADERAWFYRSVYRAHGILAPLIPDAFPPSEDQPPGRFYRSLRFLFRRVEQLFAPRPRR